MKRLIVFVVLLLTVSLPALGQNAGYDAFQTGSGAMVDLPGIGQVQLQGVALQSSTGNADTIMYRPQAVPSGGGTIPVNLYALCLKSTSPVTINGQQVDLYVTVNNTAGVIPTSSLPQPDTLTPSAGTITVHSSTSTFDSSITINADVVMVTSGGSLSNPAQIMGSQPAPAITLAQTGSSYSLTPPAGYPLSPTSKLPSGGIYFSPVHQGPHPVIPGKVVGCGVFLFNDSLSTDAAKTSAAAVSSSNLICLKNSAD